MAELISPKANVHRIEDHVRRALRAATARGGDVAETAQARLGPAVAAIDSALGVLNPAVEAEAVAWAKVLAEDAKSDTGIKVMRDEMWNALGRPRQSPFLDQVFPGGVTTYTAGDPTEQPALMSVLRSRLLVATAPQWSKEQRESWAAEIDALRQTYQAAVEAHRPIEAAATLAGISYRSAVRAGQARLRAFKRDLQNLGLSEAQIHEIIPGATPAAQATPPASPNGGVTPEPAPGPTPGTSGH